MHYKIIFIRHKNLVAKDLKKYITVVAIKNGSTKYFNTTLKIS